MQIKNLIALADDTYLNTDIPIFLLDHKKKILNFSSAKYFAIQEDFFLNYFPFSSLQDNLSLKLNRNELVAVIKTHQKTIAYVMIGPILIYETQVKERQGLFTQKYNANTPYLSNQFWLLISMFYLLIFNKYLSTTALEFQLYQDQKYIEIAPQIKSLLFQKRENPLVSYDNRSERLLLHFVGKGETSSAKLYGNYLLKGEFTQLSSNSFQSMKYALIIIISLMTRKVIHKGISAELTYNLSDLLVFKTDKTQKIKELHPLFMYTIEQFCYLVNQNSMKDYPLWIRESMEYIGTHLHQMILLSDIAQEVNLSSNYCSTQFKKIVGKPLTQYINEQKIEEASFLLETTDNTIIEISTLLSFSSPSYFSQIFKRIVGISPKSYKQNVKK